MSNILIYHLDHSGTVIATFRPENLSFTLNKGENGPHDISYELSRSAITSADPVGPYRTDFHLVTDAFDDPVVVMAGMHTMVSVASDQEMVQFAGKDWLHYLEKRYWPFDDSDPNFYRLGHPTSENDPPEGFAYYVSAGIEGLDSMQIVEEMLTLVLGLTNSLDITTVLSPIGHVPNLFTVDLIDSENVLSKIQSLSQEDPGQFDFWIDPMSKDLVVVAPRQYDIGVADDYTLAVHYFDSTNPGSEIFTVSWTNTGPAETRLTATGSNPSVTLTAVRAYSPSSDVFRLLEGQANFGTVFEPNKLQRMARKKLLFDLNPVHEVTLSVLADSIPDFWSTFYPGKAIWIHADLEVHLIDAAFEIVSMDGTTDSNGNIQVDFRLNQIYPAEELDV